MPLVVGNRQAPRHSQFEFPPDRATWWKPGVTLNGGIPLRADTTPLTPSGGNDATQINTAITNAADGSVVMLGAGEFKVYGLGERILLNKNNVTLRGTVGPNGEWLTTIRHYQTDGVTRGIERFNYIPEFAGGGHRYVTPVVVGTEFPQWDNTTGVRLTADAIKGTYTVSVQSTTGYAAGQYVAIDEEHWPKCTYQEMPPHFDGSPNPYMVYRTDKLTFRHHWKRFAPNIGDYMSGDNTATNQIDLYDPITGQRPNNFLGWFARGGGRHYNEIKKIVDVNAGNNTITFEHPLHTTYRVSYNAEVCRTGSTITTGVGVEDLSIVNGTAGGVSFGYAASCWAKNVEVREWLGYGINFDMSYRCELRGSYVHHGAWPVPGSGGYAVVLGRATSDTLIEDCVMLDANKVNVVNAAGAGCVVAYCYADDGYVWGRPQGDWVECGLNPSHTVGSHGVLFEGNECWNYDSDGTHGASLECVWFRNRARGHRRSFTGLSNARCLGLGAYSQTMSFVGNVLGTPGQMSGWTLEPSGNWGTTNFLRIGYDDQNWNQTQDASTRTTTLFLENYAHLPSSPARQNPTDKTLPPSLYRKAKPEFFEAGDTWPWVDPITGTTHTLPATRRFEQRWAARSQFPVDAQLMIYGTAPVVNPAGGGSPTITPPTGGLVVTGQAINGGAGSDATDDFNRGSLGANWTSIYGAVAITSNQLSFGSGNNAAYYNAFTPGANWEVELDFVTDGNGGVIGNATDSGAGSFYIGIVRTSGSSIWRNSGGSFEQIASGSSVSTGGRVKLARVGNTITLYYDGSQIAQVTDSTLSGGYGGVYNFDATGSYDNFRVATL